ncbi:MAG: nucleoside hydrolase [Treponema sp.]|jgi:hypothetical protein|nr:nucleoside hydrolase [Treponema sp.]
MNPYAYKVPEEKRVRMIVHTDCANEADDQFALAHFLMTPKFEIPGIVAGHFDLVTQYEFPPYKKGETAKASLDEIHKVLGLMELGEKYPVALGSGIALRDEETPAPSEGAEFIIKESMRDDPRPLFIANQGAVTDVASAIIMEPRICDRMTAIWIGGGIYPAGGQKEFNLNGDINAANVLFKSSMPVWQIPMDVYKSCLVSLAELQLKVKPCGKIGEYLFTQLVTLNEKLGFIPNWPNGESWCLGDQPAVSVLLQEVDDDTKFIEIQAPSFDRQSNYVPGVKNKKIRVYQRIDVRFTLEDFFAKLALNYGA